MMLTDDEVRLLREQPDGLFRVSQVRAVAGDSNQPPRRVAVYPKCDPAAARLYDDPEEIVEFNEGDEIELVPHANMGGATHGPGCLCPICTATL